MLCPLPLQADGIYISTALLTRVHVSCQRFSSLIVCSAPARLRRRATKPAAVLKEMPLSELRKSLPASTQVACNAGWLGG